MGCMCFSLSCAGQYRSAVVHPSDMYGPAPDSRAAKRDAVARRCLRNPPNRKSRHHLSERHLRSFPSSHASDDRNDGGRRPTNNASYEQEVTCPDKGVAEQNQAAGFREEEVKGSVPHVNHPSSRAGHP